MTTHTRAFTVSLLTAGVLVTGVGAGTTAALAKPPAYCSPSVGCIDEPGTSNDHYVTHGTPTPPDYQDKVKHASKCIAATFGGTFLGASSPRKAIGALLAAYAAC